VKKPCSTAIFRFPLRRSLSMVMSAVVKVFGCRPHEGGAAHAEGRRTQTSNGGNRGRCGEVARPVRSPTLSVRDRAIIVLNDHRFWGYASGPSSSGNTLPSSIHGHAARRSALPRERFSPLTQRRHGHRTTGFHPSKPSKARGTWGHLKICNCEPLLCRAGRDP
jgi:hypothetical protein